MYAEPKHGYQTVDPDMGYCVRCGTPRNPTELYNCPACGEVDWDPFTVTPSIVPAEVRFELPPPFNGTRGEWGRVIGIRGAKGIGKSTLMAKLCLVGFPDPAHPEWGGGAWWITGEESGNQVRSRNGRIGLPNVTVHHVDPHKPHLGMNDFYSKVAKSPPKVVVLDSASVFGPLEGMKICEGLRMWAQKNQALVGVIVQLNKAGEAAGLEALGHLVDAWGFAGSGRAGLRDFGLDKNRFGNLFNQHWRFDDRGQIVSVDFTDRILTVVGEPGSYELLPFPLKDKGRMHEVWAYLQDLSLGGMSDGIGVLPDYLGCATAGIRAPFLPHGFEIPDDAPDRKRYAELHGARWVDPRQIPSLRILRDRAQELTLERVEREECPDA